MVIKIFREYELGDHQPSVPSESHPGVPVAVIFDAGVCANALVSERAAE